MTAILNAPATVVGPIAVRANLLPAEVTEARWRRSVTNYLVMTLVAIVAVVAMVYALTARQASAARHARQTQDAAVAALIAQQSQFATLTNTRIEIAKLQNELRGLTKTDMPWYQVLAAIRSAAPAGLSVTAVNGTVTAGAPGVALPNTTGHAQAATLTISGLTRDKATLGRYVTALASVSSLTSPVVSSVVVQGPAYQYSVQAVITTAALGGRYTPKAAR